MKTLSQTVLILSVLMLCSLSGPARALRPYGSSYSNAAQDATGRVWAVGYGGQQDGSSDGVLSCWLSVRWTLQTISGAAGFHSVALSRGGDGSVYALWQKIEPGSNQMQPYLVTVHRGVNSRVLAHFSAPASSSPPNTSGASAIFADARGDVWVGSGQPILWHIAPDGSVQKFPLNAAQYFRGEFPQGWYPPTIASLVDGMGRRWFWRDSAQDGFMPSGLRGVLIWNGKTLDYHATLLGVPDQPFVTISPLDANHVWVSSGNPFMPTKYGHSTLYRVDIHTLTATAETPQQGVFHYVTQVFQAAGDWYAIDQQSQQDAALWRRHNGQWRRCMESLAALGTYRLFGSLYPWLDEPTGLWLGGTGGVLWLPRNNQPSLWVDWRRGVPALSVSGLYPLADGKLLAAGCQGDAEIFSTPQPIRPLPPGLNIDGMGAPKGLGPVMADPQHHLWGICNEYSVSAALAEWDGRQWHLHVLPKGVTGISGLYAFDTLGRLWLSTDKWHPSTQPQPVYGYAVYDPVHDRWTNYTTVQDALQSAAANPAMAFLTHHSNFNPPIFSGDGRVTYSENQTITFYDGKTWRVWHSGDVLTGYDGNTPSNLHFNTQGRLELALDVQVCEWTPDGGWQKMQQARPVVDTGFVPPGGPKDLSVYPTVDEAGEEWFTWDGIYTEAYGLWTHQEELSEPGSPFRCWFSIDDVLRDPAGRLFFVTHSTGHPDLFVWSPPSVPKPALTATALTDDAIEMRVQEKLAGPHWFRWRLSGGEWSKPQAMDAKTSVVMLTTLPAGNYRLEAQVLDHHLQPSPPSVAVISIRAVSDTQLTGWVHTLLFGTDDAREVAVAALLRQPDAALPALQAARPTASESGTWWIDAAVQQITDAKQKPGGAGN